MQNAKYLGMNKSTYWSIIVICILITITTYGFSFKGEGRSGLGQILGMIIIFRASIDYKENSNVIKFMNYTLGILAMLF